MNRLPDAAVTSEPTMGVVAEVPGLGAIRFTFKRFYHRRGKSSSWFWTVESAVRVPDQAGQTLVA
jgi:hypothetical protein